jgi:uncharacterized SAM-binding protein YcdF (DUF218 family)
MFFFFSKILYFLLTPLFWIAFLFLLSFIIKKPARARKFRIAAFACLMFFSNNFFVDLLIKGWERPEQPVLTQTSYAAGVVLGGGMAVYDKEHNKVIFRDNTDRFLQAVALYKKGVIKKIVISGGAGSLVYKDMLEAPLISGYLAEIGIPACDLLVDSLSDNTYENARNTGVILKNNFPAEKVLLITSSLHMKRSAACFRRQLVIFDEYPTNKITGMTRKDIGYYLVPDADAFSRWEKLLHEMLGYLVYDIKGYL